MLVDGHLLLDSAFVDIRSLDPTRLAIGGVDFNEISGYNAAVFTQAPCFDVDYSGTVGIPDHTLFLVHSGHSVPRQLLTPNGGQTWTTGSTASVTWQRGRGDSARVELYARKGVTGSRILLAHARPDTGAASITVPAALDTCTGCLIEVQHTAGTYTSGPSGIEIGSDKSDAAITVLDGIRPAKASLSIDLIGQHSLSLVWTALGDDSLTRSATQYDIRYSTSPITTSTWASATQATGEPTPQPAGEEEFFTLSGLLQCTRYYVAIKTRDEASNWSALSNNPNAKTSCGAVAQGVRLDSEPPQASTESSSHRVAGDPVALSRLALELADGGESRQIKLYRVEVAIKDSAAAHDFGWQAGDGRGEWRPAVRRPTLEGEPWLGIAGRWDRAGRVLMPLDAGATGVSATYRASSDLATRTYDLARATLGAIPLDPRREDLAGVVARLTPSDTLSLTYVPRDRADDDGLDYWSSFSIHEVRVERIEPGRQAETATVLPTKFALRVLGPNPSAGRLAVQFDVPLRSNLELDVMDVQGRRVAVLARESFEPGRYEAAWPASAGGGTAAPGLYFVRLRVDGRTLATTRVVLTP
ncbi:MAG: hypothetical protein HOP12_05600 [Candidatus Eisenbacteria bacterium]|uniref:Fibronectin type-III domain-containing protein n=1 Tax=Eiseniibacteriota bacterium TaxID=2212470 RepID=A0A849SGP8_UNCEI|nr:hypothetical protein [Candidatus Eisenbacteria bacterium]